MAMEGATPDEDEDEIAAREALNIADGIKPFLAGHAPEIQGAVLAELLSLWLAGFHLGGDGLMDAMLTMHVGMVRRLVPQSVLELRKRLGKPS